MKNWIFAAAMILVVAMPGAAGVADPPPAPTVKTYTYKTVDGVDLQADVYRPGDAEPRPVLLWLHGGALISGGKKDVAQDLVALCRAEGYCLVSANYRLAPEAKLPQIIDDLRDFIRWASEKGPALFHADASRVMVAGQSAGGYLTMMAGLCEPKPKALVAYWGYGDVDGPWYTQPSAFYRRLPLVTQADALKALSPTVIADADGAAFRGRGKYYLWLRQNGLWTREVSGLDPATEPEKLDPYCPVRNITASYPPILMVHGTADTDVPCRESIDMDAALTTAGVRHELLTVPNAGHMLGGGGDPKLKAKALALAREFIKECLSAPAAATQSGAEKPGSP